MIGLKQLKDEVGPNIPEVLNSYQRENRKEFIMHDILKTIEGWIRQDKSIALATVVRTWGSSPRGIGAKMAVTAEGEMVGSVSGGCVESAVVEAGMECLITDIPRLLHFGVSDETAWDVGLACGGEIDVFVRILDTLLLDTIQKWWDNNQLFINGVVINGPAEIVGCEFLMREGELVLGTSAHSHDSLIGVIADRIQDVKSPCLLMLQSDPFGSIEIFVDIFQPLPTLVIVGGVHIAVTLVTLANALGYRTIVIDPRKKFGNQERFPHASQIINAWPKAAFKEINLNSSTAVAVLTHDPKIDDPALKLALPSPVFYVGALGSQKTQSMRCQRLLDMGLTREIIGRLHGPIGLALGGRSPDEIALGIMAEIVLGKNQGFV